MNVPNALSTLRLLLVPVFVIIFFADIPNAHRWAGLVFAVAAATDTLDGYIARRFNLITRLGRFLDPFADKLMTAAAIACMIFADIVPLWIFIVFLVKEGLMAIGSIVLFSRVADLMPSNVFGKVSTVVFFASCLAIMLFAVTTEFATLLMTFALALTLVAFFVYLVKLLRILRTNGESVGSRKGN